LEAYVELFLADASTNMGFDCKTMTDSQRKVFDGNYLDALRAHMIHKRRGGMTSQPARKIGKQAVVLGLNAMDLARTHDQAMRHLEPIGAADAKGATPISAAAIFFIEALAPLEQVRKTELAKSQRVERKLERQLEQEIKKHNKLLVESQRQQEKFRRLAHKFFLAQEKERKEISRDLHDEIAQVLAGINVRLAALKKIAQINRSDTGEQIDQTQKLVEQSVAAVHVPSLRSYIKNLAGREDLRIRFNADSEVDVIGNEQRTALYRVAQEALTNVVRHAQAKCVHVSLRKLSDRIRLEVHDDGKSFNPKRILNSISNTRLGLLGMRERIEMFGGSFSILSTPAKGTTVTAEIPLASTSIKNEQ
jgi:signal transduction histidine kinase